MSTFRPSEGDKGHTASPIGEAALEQRAPLAPHDFLAGGGEMGALIRATDWSRTPLGPVEQWPQSLKIAVRIMLTSRQPIWLGWGEQLIKLYNDPYKAIVGGKHPTALGQPASVVWREIWPEIEPMLRTAMGGIEGTYVEAQLLIMERNGYPEETYYTFSFSPIPDDQGGVGGIICANTDDTERVLGERQLALLKELAAKIAYARTFDEACRLSSASLETNRYDFPFALIYLVEPAEKEFVLAATSGIERDHAAAVGRVAFDEVSFWPLMEVTRMQKPSVISNVTRLFDDLPTGAWRQPPQQAVAVPIVPSGQTGKSGILIAGLNPFRLFDDRYQRFVHLVAAQIAAGIANAQAYEAERKRAEALAELDRAKTAFFSNVSHEFRTPLTLMLGPLEDLKAQFGRSESLLDAGPYQQVDVVHRNGLRLLKLVNTLLDFSRIEAGRMQAAYEETDLAALTAELASVFRSAIEKAGLSLIVNCPPLPEPVFVDRDMWEKIVLNLLSNAFKFTFDGEIEVSLREDGERREAPLTPGLLRSVTLRVRDTGTGIPEDQLGKIFERFHRVAGSRGRTHEGTGIGLALVQELARLHGGSVSVESVYGKGSTFTVTLPLGTAHLPADRINADRTLASTATGAASFVEESLRWLPDDERTEERGLRTEVSDGETATQSSPGLSPQSSVLSTEGTPPRVLLADDNADMRGYVRRLLSSQGYEVEAVGDGQAALDQAKAHPPDLVLTDVMMPRLDGFGLLRALRDDPATKTIPVILLSARAGEESRVEGLEHGADDYLIKPFSARELLARVHSQLELARLRRAAGEAVRESEERVRHSNAELAHRVVELQTANIETRDARLAALNLMEDAIKSRQAMERLNVELRESENRYRTLFTSAPMAVFFCDKRAVIQYYNQRAVELWGRAPEHGVERYWGSAKLWLPDGTRMSHPQSPMVDVLRTGVPAHNVEVVIERPDGSRLPVLVNCAAVKNAQGDIAGAITSFMDITERKETEERLRQFTVELEQRVSERTQELARSEDRLRMLATELNLAEQRERKRLATDLHDYLAQLLVLGRMTLSQAKRTGLSPRAEDFVQQTEESLGKALTYCRTLMAELSPPVLQERGLPAGLTWLADHMQRQELAVTVDLKQAGDVPLPEDCAVLLFQSVRELLINVAKHGTVKEATVRMTYEDGLLGLVVRDENGFDLAAAAAAAADNASPLSSKFGLFSIRERMKALGGRFDIQSAPGQGTTATLTLPVAEAQARGTRLEARGEDVEQVASLKQVDRHARFQNAPLSEPLASRPLPLASPRVRVLLVDDHTVMRQGLRSIVTAYNHLEVVGEAGDGVEAVELAQRLDPHVVVMDINMPKMDGIEATKRIKADRPNTVVIGLSVNQSFDTEQKMKAAGAVAYLTKESAVDVLCQAIEKAVSYQQGAAAR